MRSFLFLSLMSFLCVYIPAGAQTTATATFTASVTVIEPISITTVSHMNFASLDAGMGGEIILTPQNTRTTKGDVRLAEETNVSAAAFIVNGDKGHSYSITLPQEGFILSNGSQNIRIKDFTSDIGRSAVLTNGSSEIRVGATLEIDPQQIPGNYRSIGSIPITVNYN